MIARLPLTVVVALTLLVACQALFTSSMAKRRFPRPASIEQEEESPRAPVL